jgi:hypothetical protein
VEARLQNILEAASYDPDRLPAPKEFWVPNKKNDEALKQWYEDRDKERRRRGQQPLEDY